MKPGKHTLEQQTSIDSSPTTDTTALTEVTIAGVPACPGSRRRSKTSIPSMVMDQTGQDRSEKRPTCTWQKGPGPFPGDPYIHCLPCGTGGGNYWKRNVCAAVLTLLDTYRMAWMVSYYHTKTAPTL